MAEGLDMQAEARTAGQFAMPRQRVLVSLVPGIGSVVLGWVPGRLSATTGRWDYQVVARWRIPGGGRGLIIAVGADPTHEALRLLGEQLKDEFGHLEDAVVMVFDDAEAARLVRQGSGVVDEKKFRKALLHQRAMYLRSSARGVHSLTIYDTYAEPHEVIHYGSIRLREPKR